MEIKKEEQSEENVSVENVSEDSISVVEAKGILEELRKENQTLKKQLDRAESLEASKILSGEAVAGQPEKSQEQKEIEAAKKVIAGSGFEDLIG